MRGAVTAVLLVALVLVWVVLLRAYRRQRAAAAAAASGPPPVSPAPPQATDAVGTRHLAADGDFAGTALAGTWAPATVAGDVPGPVAMTVGSDGVAVERAGDVTLVVPAWSLRGVRAEAGGVVLLTWDYGGDLLDTGFRPRDAAATDRLVAAVASLLRGSPTPAEVVAPAQGDAAAPPDAPIASDRLDRLDRPEGGVP